MYGTPAAKLNTGGVPAVAETVTDGDTCTREAPAGRGTDN